MPTPAKRQRTTVEDLTAKASGESHHGNISPNKKSNDSTGSTRESDKENNPLDSTHQSESEYAETTQRLREMISNAIDSASKKLRQESAQDRSQEHNQGQSHNESPSPAHELIAKLSNEKTPLNLEQVKSYLKKFLRVTQADITVAVKLSFFWNRRLIPERVVKLLESPTIPLKQFKDTLISSTNESDRSKVEYIVNDAIQKESDRTIKGFRLSFFAVIRRHSINYIQTARLSYNNRNQRLDYKYACAFREWKWRKISLAFEISQEKMSDTEMKDARQELRRMTLPLPVKYNLPVETFDTPTALMDFLRNFAPRGHALVASESVTCVDAPDRLNEAGQRLAQFISYSIIYDSAWYCNWIYFNAKPSQRDAQDLHWQLWERYTNAITWGDDPAQPTYPMLPTKSDTNNKPGTTSITANEQLRQARSSSRVDDLALYLAEKEARCKADLANA